MNAVLPISDALLMPTRDRILVADSDFELRQSVCLSLADNGFDVCEATSYSDLGMVETDRTISLAVMEPDGLGGNGMQLVRFICDQVGLPLIIVSNKGRALNKVIGLELGADDYMCKPIDMDELVARIRAVLRRTRRQRLAVRETSIVRSGPPRFRFEGWELDAGRRTLACPKGVLQELTSTEIDLLVIFAKNPQVALSREVIIERLGKRSDSAAVRTIDVLVSKLRRKLEREGNDIIKTVRGAGYVFTASVAVS